MLSNAHCKIFLHPKLSLREKCSHDTGWQSAVVYRESFQWRDRARRRRRRCGYFPVSPFAGLWGTATGQSILAYGLGGRLSEPARKLAGGAPDIVSVALDAGYASHEASTRTFGQQFGMMPEYLRNLGSASTLDLVEPLAMTEVTSIKLTTARIVDGKSLMAASLAQRYCDSTTSGMPSRWQKFVA